MMAAKYGTNSPAKSFLLLVLINLTVKADGSSLTAGRFLNEMDYSSSPQTKFNGTERIDPLDDFNKYRGGYDITNKHYWSSIAFTGIYGYSTGILWLLCGLGFGGFLLADKFCCKSSRKLKKPRSPCHWQCYIWLTLLATFFTILAITATGLVLSANARFHSRAKTVIDIIIDTADGASYTIYNTTGAIKDMSNSLGPSNGGDDEASEFLGSTSKRLDDQADDILRQARKNRRAIDKGLKIMYIITSVIISLSLIVAVSLPVAQCLKRQTIFHVLISVCWVLTVVCWLLFGIYFFLSRFAGDTCTALEGFQQDPYNNSLSSILPCNELLSARSLIYDVREGIFDIVNEVNRNITKSYGKIVQICNPFAGPPAYQYQGEYCPENTIRIGDIPQVLKMLTCTEGETCNGGIFISSNDFNSVVAYTTSIQNLMNVFPGMEDLIECRTVRDAFSVIVQGHCKPLKRYVRMEWSALVFLAMVMVVLVLIWTIKAKHERKHNSLGSSVKPHIAAEDNLEPGTRKELADEYKTSPTFT